MVAPDPRIRSVADIKHRLFHPALTSHYECNFHIPNSFSSLFQGTASNFIGKTVPVTSELTNLITLSCCESSLPGSNLATHELNNDFTGVTQRHAYRRLYDDRADFTFYVDTSYNQIKLFERWMQFIVGEQITNSDKLNSHYRMMYPKTYKTTIYITKFERTATPKVGPGPQNESNESYDGTKLYYSFFNAFPISVASMPVSYESSSLLKCTVSFTYDRYVATSNPLVGQDSQPSQLTANGVPNPDSVSYINGSILQNAFTRNASIVPADLFKNTSPNRFNISSGTLSNSVGEGEEIINAINSNQRRVEEGLPYVGRNRGPIAPFSGIQ